MTVPRGDAAGTGKPKGALVGHDILGAIWLDQQIEVVEQRFVIP